MAELAPYHNPTDFGTFDLGTAQVDKTFRFDWDADVLANAKAVATYRGNIIHTYEVGSGITIENGNRRVTVTMSGATYAAYAGNTITVSCNFFVEGDEEVTYDVKIVKTPL